MDVTAITHNVALTRAETTYAKTKDAYSASGVEGIVIRRIDSRSYRRYGTNWGVWQGEKMACDAQGNVWCFRTKKQAKDYLNEHTPEFFRDV